MKKCPFCAEEIQVDAIKCKHCGSFLSQAPAGAAAAQPAPQAAAQPAPQAAAAPQPAGPPFARAAGEAQADDRKLLYSGSPSWRAYIGHYLLIGAIALIVPILMFKIAGWVDASSGTKAVMTLIPLGVAAIYYAGLYLYRKSVKVRVTTTNIETERGILSKRIDVLELWRCRDVRYRQNLLDRMLGIAHIDIFTADVTTPTLEIAGLPASRQLFEQIRDSIELQRQHRNVYGVVS